MEPGFTAEENPAVPGTRALQRAMGLLRAFDDEHPRWSLSALSIKLDLSKSTVHRILTALEREGFLLRPYESTEFQLGPELIVLGSRALRAVDVRGAARPELRLLAEKTGEDVTLESLVGSEVLILDEQRGRNLMGVGTPIGTLWPAHATSTGKVLLADAPEAMKEPEAGLVAFTANTIVSWEEWTATLEEVRRNGYATNIEELEYGFAAVAAPVWDRNGRTTAAISVGGSIQRIGKDRIPDLVETVRVAALRVSERLGYRRTNERS
jgi:DNA-binding IclR family transcriptional regulator